MASEEVVELAIATVEKAVETMAKSAEELENAWSSLREQKHRILNSLNSLTESSKTFVLSDNKRLRELAIKIDALSMRIKTRIPEI